MIIYCWSDYGYDGYMRIFIAATSLEGAREVAKKSNRLSPHMLKVVLDTEPQTFVEPQVAGIASYSYY